MAASVPDDVPPRRITELLVAWRDGDQAAADQLVSLVHAELRRLARRHMRGERDGHTLQTTALVNEAYLRLLAVNRVTWQDRGHFFAMASRLMGRILVDHARSRNVQKRGGDLHAVPLDEALGLSTQVSVDLLALDAALSKLAVTDPRKAQVVEMRYYGGFSVAETAEALSVSVETVARDWRIAKLWLLRELQGLRDAGPDDPQPSPQ
ncbi:sigma-70 family RNA polymerase sigma factor [Luteitalea sp.]|jgi:RNA polymerase sigma factor (TIGR02999 family)|uniref:sigma-70 family RNA polymerase sigma factor n=1 Tax=Luteitalea sp. TaxID=2004800 RepID=UPI0037C9B97C